MALELLLFLGSQGVFSLSEGGVQQDMLSEIWGGDS
jgi:hypothetical protein